MATVKLIFKIEKVDSAGEVPLYLRITKDRKSRYVSLGVKINPDKHWNEKDRKVKKSHPNSQRLNNFIAQKIAEAEGLALSLETSAKPASSKSIKDTLKGAASTSFLKYADTYIDTIEKKGKISTATKARAIIAKLRAYLGTKELHFEEITVSFLKAYEHHLSHKLGNSTNTIHANLKVIRRLFNEAVSEDLIPFEKNPFLKYKLKLTKTVKNFLTEEELKALEDFEITAGTMKWHHRNMYVFAAYAGGVRISDVLLLKYKHFDGERILLDTYKTGSTISVKLPQKALDIINLYVKDKPNADEFIFPILKANKEYKDPKVLFRAISSATAYANKNLKSIAEKLEFSHNLNFHSSRHTWATRALRKGMRIEYVSKLMGHSSIKTTQIYAKIVSEELDKAMEVFD
ncbi:site-specific integrase [Pontibacter amylolyticus]|uniref:Integrase n=1 Tax=Pontibacter amylolyticus TaxID=1424080 RepID=A0ABQ1W944_9BACT|nr:site-specific integrase [Pontibacter amylolyticus]GGG18172.1 integrase [Pontibacter amylolyticus]